MPSNTPTVVIAGLTSVGDIVAFGRFGEFDAFGSLNFARPKSRTFTDTGWCDLDVGRLEIAMDDALLVRRFEGVGDLPRDGERVVHRQRLAAMRSASVSPSTSSITSARTVPLSSRPWIAAMCG